ncbi:MAG: OmpA family protein [Burkholderiales bacterium]|nr:OmpA family protein [Burkholderiales bacterium]
MWPRNRLEDRASGARRRRGFLRGAARLVCAGALALLAGCQGVPEDASRAQRHAELRSMGFVETDDGWMLQLAEPILFELDSDELRADVHRTIVRLAAELRRVGVRQIRIEGHTDSTGEREHNFELSLRRAETVAQAFVDGGFPSGGIVRRGLGFDYPAASNATGDGRALNRRVTIMVGTD